MSSQTTISAQVFALRNPAMSNSIHLSILIARSSTAPTPEMDPPVPDQDDHTTDDPSTKVLSKKEKEKLKKEREKVRLLLSNDTSFSAHLP